MIHKKVYIYIRNLKAVFDGTIKDITSDNLVIIEISSALTYIPIDLIDVITVKKLF